LDAINKRPQRIQTHNKEMYQQTGPIKSPLKEGLKLG